MCIWRMDKWLFLDELLTICALKRKHYLVILGVSILKIANRQRRPDSTRRQISLLSDWGLLGLIMGAGPHKMREPDYAR